jgi:TolB-like protein/tetratricopeptide (TPR) repeat protein
MSPEAFNYDALLESLADGAEIDWAAIEAAAKSSDERRQYGNLRLVARVAELHRTLVLEEDAPPHPVHGVDEAPGAARDTWGHLSIRARLASGAFGQIFRAHDPQLSRDVALKLLRGDISAYRPVERLLAEARTLAKVRHPNVVTVYGADVRDGAAGLWMELVDGQTLETWLRTHGALGSGEASAVGIDMCRALAAVHAAGLVHGDVKAQNVMREHRGRVVLMDFGAGRAQGADAAGMAGTPMYLAPEVLAGEPPTPQSDLYSLGVLLFHLLTDGYPFAGADLDGLRAAHADGTRTWLRDLRPDLPDGLVRTIERAIDPDPARRFRTAGEMERALANALQHPLPPGVVVKGAAPVLLRRWGFALGALALLAVVVGLIVWSRAAATVPAIRSIAVLPMKDLSGSAQLPYLADGLHDQLITTLGQVQALRVTSRTSVLQFKDSQASAGEIAKVLGVEAVLESTVSSRRGSDDSPGLVKVNASLMLAGASTPLWSKSFERPLGELLALEGEMAREIASSVRATISPEVSAFLNRPTQTSPAVEEAYFQGRRQLEQYGSDRARLALQAFERAIMLDPHYAAAHAGAARAYFSLGFNGDISQPAARASAVAEIQKALALNASLPEARVALADVKFYYDWDWGGADAEYRQAIDLNRSFTDARRRYASFLAATQRLDEAVQQALEAETLDPLSAEAATTHGMALYYRRDYEAARATLGRALQLEPGSASALILLGRVAEAQAQFEDALQKTREALQLSGGGSIPLRMQIVCLEALAGRKDDAHQDLRALQRNAAAGKLRISGEYLAYAHIALGEQDTALDLLEQAVDDRDPGLLWLAVDPRVDPVRSNPRFAALLSKLKLPEKHTAKP